MDEQVREIEQQASAFREDYARVREQIQRVVVGHPDIVEGVLTCLFVGGHVLLEGAPGLGKTLLIRTLAGALSLRFGRIQFTPDLMPADVMGTTIVAEVEGESGRSERVFRFQRGPIFAQIILADEINRATPKTQSALLEAMQERSVTVAGETHALPAPFFVMATQNPIEQEGTYPLPEAQLDRFFFKLLVQPSGREDLAEILRRTTTDDMPAVEPVLDDQRIVAHQRLVRQVAIAPHIQDYAIRMVLATQPAAAAEATERRQGEASPARFSTPMVDRYVRYGASPRAAQALVLAAKCRALIDARPSVSTDDIRSVAPPALRHRIIMNFEAEAEGISSDAIVRNIAETLPLDAS